MALLKTDDTVSIIKMLESDASCVSEETQAIIAKACEEKNTGLTVYPVMYDDHEVFGWYIFLNDNTSTDIPKDLTEIFEIAKKLGCQIIRLDDSGDIADENSQATNTLAINSRYISENTATVLNGTTGPDAFDTFDIVVFPTAECDNNRQWFISFAHPNLENEDIPGDLPDCLKLAAEKDCHMVYLYNDKT